MCDKAKGLFKGKFERLKELIVNNKVIVAILALFLIAFAVLIIVTATMPDANRLNYTEKADGTLEVAEIKNTYKDGWFCRDSLIVPEEVKGKKVTSVARLDSAKLQEIVLPDSVTEIKEEAFAGCSSLREITLGDTLQTVGDGAWKNCPSLHKLLLPQSIQTFGKAVFEGTPIEYNTVGGMNYVGNEENPYLVLVGAEETLSVARVHEETKVAAKACFEGSGIADADMGNLTHLPEDLFAGCRDLIRADISAATELGAHCFEQCANLTDVVFCERLSVIGERAFSGCGKLKSVTIGSGVKKIGDRTFAGCDGLKEVHAADLAAWCKIEFGAFEANPLSVAHRLFIGGEEIVNLQIPEGVTAIAKGAFMFCDSFKSVEIPASVSAIDEYAFIGCGGLEEVRVADLSAWCKIRFGTFGANPLSVARRLFVGGKEIVNLQIPEGTASIADRAFQGFDRLITVDIPQSVTSVGEAAFEKCTALESIAVEKENRSYSSRDGILYDKRYNGGKETVGKIVYVPMAIKGCVTIPASVASIDKKAFEGRSELQEVRFEEAEGWEISPDGDMAFAGVVFGLDDPEFAAKALTDIYCGYYWKREG